MKESDDGKALLKKFRNLAEKSEQRNVVMSAGVTDVNSTSMETFVYVACMSERQVPLP